MESAVHVIVKRVRERQVDIHLPWCMFMVYFVNGYILKRLTNEVDRFDPFVCFAISSTCSIFAGRNVFCLCFKYILIPIAMYLTVFPAHAGLEPQPSRLTTVRFVFFFNFSLRLVRVHFKFYSNSKQRQHQQSSLSHLVLKSLSLLCAMC